MNVERVMTTTYSRRRLLAVGGTTMAAGLAARFLPTAALAHSATAATLGYGELTVTVEEKAITVPASVPAGLTFTTLKNASKNGELVVAWGRLASGVTKDEVTATVAAFATAQGEADLAPVAAFFSSQKMTLIGGPQGPAPGKTSSGVVRLTEGNHVIFNPFNGQAAFFDVAPAAAGAKTEEPKADLTVKLGNMVFVGLDQGVPAGKHLWQVENIDTMEHELIIAPLEPGQTADDFKKMLEQFSGESGDAGANQQGSDQQGGDQAAPEGGDQAANQPNGGASIMSSGEKVWQIIDLPAGHYAAFCMIPMNWSGPPHAMMGMIKVFDAK